MNKKELHFWQLSFIFIFIIICALLYNWGYKVNKQSSMTMMSKSMGNMMSSMHLKNITLGNLLINEAASSNSNKQEDMSSHHSGVENHIKYIHNVSTVVIVLLLPFIIGGTVFLSIIWIKK